MNEAMLVYPRVPDDTARVLNALLIHSCRVTASRCVILRWDGPLLRSISTATHRRSAAVLGIVFNAEGSVVRGSWPGIMEAKIARRRAKQENSPPRSADEQLATSLQSSRSVLVSTLVSAAQSPLETAATCGSGS